MQQQPPIAFSDATAIHAREPGTWHCTIPEGWGQGRSVFGGITAAVLVRAMTAAVDDSERSLRSFTSHFCGPVRPGSTKAAVVVESRSSRLAHVSCRLEQGGETVAIGTGAFGRARATDMDQADASAPEGIPWEQAPQIPAAVGVPEFARRLELRWSLGALPMSGSTESRVGFWVSTAGELVLDAALAIALTDAPPPAFLARMTGRRPIATVAYTARIVAPLPRPCRPDAVFLVTRTSRDTLDGYNDETQTLWTSDGIKVLEASQTIALIV